MTLINEMSQTIDRFRSFFQRDLEMLPCSLGKELFEALYLIGGVFADRQIRIYVTSCDDDEPIPLEKVDRKCSWEEKFRFRGYPHEFRQVVLALLNNAAEAIKARKDKEPQWSDEGAITLRIFEENRTLNITVEDNGIGISPEEEERIFEPYVSSKSDSYGSGLGLYMARNILKKMEGTLRLLPRESGACFKITVPVLS